ncbi:hypothetical protein HDE_04188 [Halotydeus destructor]|nr:hypothetical protein HDE_04188 [Halotydeus destructor]
MIETILHKVLSSAIRFVTSLILFVKSTFSAKSQLTDQDEVNPITNQYPSQRKQMYIFAKNFFQHPMMVGSIIPSSRFLIDRLLMGIDWTTAKVIVEYGPGIGNVSVEILKRMRADCKLVLIELNQNMADYCRNNFTDPRVINVQGSATDVGKFLKAHKLGKADYIVSGIPFSMLPTDVGHLVVNATHDALRPGGEFHIFQYRKTGAGLLAPTVCQD